MNQNICKLALDVTTDNKKLQKDVADGENSVTKSYPLDSLGLHGLSQAHQTFAKPSAVQWHISYHNGLAGLQPNRSNTPLDIASYRWTKDRPYSS